MARQSKDSWDNEYKTYISGISDEDLEAVKAILADDSRTAEDIEFVDKVFENVVFSNMNTVAMEELGTNATDEWKYAHANRIVQVATLTGGARDLAIAKKNSFDSIPSAFGITTKQGKMYLIKGEFNTETKLSRCKILFADQYLTINPGDLWLDIKTTGLDNEGVVAFKNSKKPEKLIRRIIALNTKKDDIVLDSFLGSGTTAAVAHKMGRRWIGVELGDHAYTHCAVRMRQVIEGEQGGISKSQNWHGGGGFKFYELAPSLLNRDKYGNLVINKRYNADMLAAAMAKKGRKVAVLDADITGPSIPTAFGIHERATGSDAGIDPAVSAGGVELMSLNLLSANETDPVIWRGPVIAGVVTQFWQEVVWGDIDYMFVDMPPGTGDVPLTVFQSLPVDGVIVVTSPQDLVSMIVAKAVNMAKMMDIPVLGLVENYSWFQCPDCGKQHAIFGESHIEKVAAELEVPVLARLPIDPALAAAFDAGKIEDFPANYMAQLADRLDG